MTRRLDWIDWWVVVAAAVLIVATVAAGELAGAAAPAVVGLGVVGYRRGWIKRTVGRRE